jgi:rhodanese-related sulfurtransferase
MNNEISVEDAAKKMSDNGVCILDVRTPNEHARGYIEGSENLDFYKGDFKSKIEQLDHSKTYIVHCGSGGRSGKAVKMMQELGFASAYNLVGGFNEWVKKGMKVVK